MAFVSVRELGEQLSRRRRVGLGVALDLFRDDEAHRRPAVEELRRACRRRSAAPSPWTPRGRSSRPRTRSTGTSSGACAARSRHAFQGRPAGGRAAYSIPASSSAFCTRQHGWTADLDPHVVAAMERDRHRASLAALASRAVAERVLTQRELNRALLATAAAARSDAPAVAARGGADGLRAVAHTPVDLPVRLWSRVAGLEARRGHQGARAAHAGPGTLMRNTIHVVSRRDYWPLVIATREERRAWSQRLQKPDERKLRRAAERLGRFLAGRPRRQREIEEAGLWLPASGSGRTSSAFLRAGRRTHRRARPVRARRGVGRARAAAWRARRAGTPRPPLPRRVRTCSADRHRRLGRDARGGARGSTRAHGPPTLP